MQTSKPQNLLTTIRSRRIAFLLAFSIFSASAVLVSGCVTVNVNFPESAVQKATDDYVRELYRAKGKDKTPASAQEEKKTTGFLSVLIPSAYADDGFKIMSAVSGQIQKKMSLRVDEIIAQKRSGALGETNEGLLVIKDKDKLGKLLAKKIEDLVAAENADRRDLYNEVLRINSLDKNRLPAIQKSFARSFQAESPSGTWLQDADGKWTQKP